MIPIPDKIKLNKTKDKVKTFFFLDGISVLALDQEQAEISHEEIKLLAKIKATKKKGSLTG